MKKILSVIVGLVSLASPSLAQKPVLAVEQKVFLESYKQAAQAGDIELYLSNIHPLSRSCMSDDYKSFLEESFLKKSSMVKNLVLDDVVLEEINAVMFGDAIKYTYRDKAYLPVVPEYYLKAYVVEDQDSMNACRSEPRGYNMSIPVSFDDGVWYEVLPCGKAGFEDYISERQAGQKAQRKRAEELYETVPVDSWSEVDPVLLQQKDKAKAAGILQKDGFTSLKARSIIAVRCEKLTEKAVNH